MKADLYNAEARTAGSNGLAHRTAAGFVVLTSADGEDLIALIDTKQNEPDLVDQLVAKANTDAPTAFAMLFTSGGDVYVIASGIVVASIASATLNLTLGAAPGRVVVHRLRAGVSETAATIRLRIGDIPAGAVTELELRDGTVEANWVEVAVGDATIATPTPTTATDPTPEPESVAVIAAPSPAAPPSVPAPPQPPTAEPPTPATPAAPVEVPSSSPEEPSDAKVGAVMVLGISCSQGHHNHPDAVYCSQCGTKMGVHHTTVLMNGPRPPLGVLVVDDGTTYSLSSDLVIGREPTSHDDVIAGTATPVALTDDTLSLSRRHARIVLDDWSVAVRDLNSSNGTFLSRAGQADNWVQLESGETIPLEPGDRLRVGGRIVQVELHHVR